MGSWKTCERRRPTWQMNLNGASSACAQIQARGAHRRSPNLAEWRLSALTCSDETEDRHFEILQIHNSIHPLNNACTVTAMLGYTLNSLDSLAVCGPDGSSSCPESSRQTVPKWRVKQLWEAFHPIPASSGRSSSTVVGQMRNTPLSSLRRASTSHPAVSKYLETLKIEHTWYIILDAMEIR